MLKKKQKERKLNSAIYRAMLAEAIREADDVDFLNDEEWLIYIKALYDAKLWGLTVK